MSFSTYGTCCGLCTGLDRARVTAETEARAVIFPGFTFHRLVEKEVWEEDRE